MTGGTVVFLMTALLVPYSRELFHVSALHGDDFALCAGVAVSGILWFEVLKTLSIEGA